MGRILGENMKTYQIWLVLEETEDDSPQYQLETYQMAVVETEKLGRAIFEDAQAVLDDLVN